MPVYPLAPSTAAAGLALAAARQRVQASAATTTPPPAPLLASTQLEVVRDGRGEPVRLHGSLALAGRTVWFTVELATQRVVLRYPDGSGWSGELAAVVAALAASPASTTTALRQTIVTAGPFELRSIHDPRPDREFVQSQLWVDPAAVTRVRALRANLLWQWATLTVATPPAVLARS